MFDFGGFIFSNLCFFPFPCRIFSLKTFFWIVSESRFMSVVKIRQRPLSEAHVTNISKELINLSFINLSTCSMLSLIKTQPTNCNVYTCTLIFSDFMKCDNQWKLLFVWVCFFKNFVRFKNFENMHVQYLSNMYVKFCTVFLSSFFYILANLTKFDVLKIFFLLLSIIRVISNLSFIHDIFSCI